MPCVACAHPTTKTFCEACGKLEYADAIRTYCLHSDSTSPVEMAQQ